MENFLLSDEANELWIEACEHLKQGRFKMALTISKKSFDALQHDYKAAICLAWAYLENIYPAEALEYADLAVQLGNEYVIPHLYRGFILMRLGIFDGAINDIDFAIEQNKKEFLSWAHHIKAQCLAGLGKYSEALKEIDESIKTSALGKNNIDNDINPNKNATQELIKIRQWYKNASTYKGTFLSKLRNKPFDLIDEAEEAFKLKEYWYSLWACKKILESESNQIYHQRAHILELETMYSLFRFKPALTKANKLKKIYNENPRFQIIYEKLMEIEKRNQNLKENRHTKTFEKKPDTKSITINKRTDFQTNINSKVPPITARMYDFVEDINTGKRKYFVQFPEASIRYIGAEVIVENPNYSVNNWVAEGTAIWYLNDNEVGRHNFAVTFDMNWRNIVFVQSWGSEEPGFWQRGQGRVDIYLQEEKICERWFLIANSEVLNLEKVNLSETEIAVDVATHDRNHSSMPVPQEPAKENPTNAEDTESLNTLFKELDSFTGLANVKQAMRDFVDYLQFINERKKQGLKTHEKLSINSIFLGNPGTGKTTIARLLGKIFKTMGILEKGHVVEVDRAALVGQYIGETAQKTEKVITDALGGLLFIDEAYTLSKKGSGADFGQEAVDTLLKRLEDKAGEFAVIAAGYPEEMNAFLESNPGMKSRFSHFFTFDDYTPDELIDILKQMAAKEDYSFDPEAEDILKKEFTRLFRKRDKTFGNARLVRNIFNDAKMQVGKRYLKLPQGLRDKSALSTITKEDIEILTKISNKKDYNLSIDEENLSSALEKLNNLTGLATVKKEINELVKLARFYIEQGEDLKNKFSEHIVFIGNPGTGKTTVARIFSQIYAALGILPKGHLVETDRQNLVASYIGKTAEKTTDIINRAIGGTLFIDEAYALIKKGDVGSSDFGKEAVDTLLKRMEDDRGKFIVIAAGYTDEMKYFLESNPGLQSRFTKSFTFEDFAPDELMQITEYLLREKKLELDENAKQKLQIFYNEVYRIRDKSFGNARLIRNIVDASARNQLLRLIDIPLSERTEELLKTIKVEDVESIISSKKEKKQVKAEGNKELLESYLNELHELIGLESVKKSVEKLISGLKVAKLREERRLKVMPKNLHAVFLGNPGTGKTTVAYLLSKIYKEMGILEKGHLIEVDRSALVAIYPGQTAKKTDSVIEQALGGTLFINEANMLAKGSNELGQEAIDTLLKRMAEFSNQFVVILAGYTNEMKEFFESNPNVQSRFTNTFTFEDYTPRQMLDIATIVSEKNGYKLDEGAVQVLLEMFTELYQNRTLNFGNARTVKNVLMKAIGNQEERILALNNLSDDDLITINYDDVNKININEI